MRLRFASLDSPTALSNVAAVLSPADVPEARAAGTAAEVYRTESAMLNGFQIVPIAQVPEAWGLSGRVKNWMQPRAGGWSAADVWLDISQGPDSHAEGRP